MKYFTREDAEQAIPELEKILASAREIRDRLEAKAETLQRLEGGTTSPDELAIESAQSEFLSRGLEETLRTVEGMGVILRGFDPGLVDFPCRVDGREVYLCWKGGERNIGFYHGIEEGFAGRKPLPLKTHH